MIRLFVYSFLIIFAQSLRRLELLPRRASRLSALDDKESGGDEEEINARAMSRPPIIPFDFAREDLPDKRVTAIKDMLEKEKVKETNTSVPPPPVPSPNPYASNDRPTGYANDIDDDPDWVPSAPKDDFQKVLKDIYIVRQHLSHFIPSKN